MIHVVVVICLIVALHASPGVIFNEAFIQELKSDLPRMNSVHIGSGMHYLQEVQPTKIGQSVAQWLLGVDRVSDGN